jgi:hypothetical protein
MEGFPMSKPEFIDVQAEIVPMDGPYTPRRAALATRARGPEQIFEPAPEPEMRGRRPSGVVFRADDVPPESAGVPIAPPPETAVTKRSAKGVAEELTGRPVQMREGDGRCFIEVVFPQQRLEFAGRTWFLALLTLKNHLDKRR